MRRLLLRRRRGLLLDPWLLRGDRPRRRTSPGIALWATTSGVWFDQRIGERASVCCIVDGCEVGGIDGRISRRLQRKCNGDVNAACAKTGNWEMRVAVRVVGRQLVGDPQSGAETRRSLPHASSSLDYFPASHFSNNSHLLYCTRTIRSHTLSIQDLHDRRMLRQLTRTSIIAFKSRSLCNITAYKMSTTQHVSAKPASQESHPQLNLGTEKQLSDKKALRKQIGSILSSLPDHQVDRQCPSRVQMPSIEKYKTSPKG